MAGVSKRSYHPLNYSVGNVAFLFSILFLLPVTSSGDTYLYIVKVPVGHQLTLVDNAIIQISSCTVMMLCKKTTRGSFSFNYIQRNNPVGWKLLLMENC